MTEPTKKMTNGYGWTTRARGPHYLMLTILSFAATVIITRTFLILTGYPQVGGRSLHIAHVLWGGLFLFVALIAIFVIASRSFYRLAAIIGGIGVGLFIDEVGKFITKDNNYFYPAAIPIIYAFLLLTIFVYLELRHFQPRDPRAELYNAFDLMAEILEHDLDVIERAELNARLEFVMEQKERPDLAQLATVLHNYLHSDAVQIVRKRPLLWQPIVDWYKHLETKYITKFRARMAVGLGIGVTGGMSMVGAVRMLWAIFVPSADQTALMKYLETNEVISSPGDFQWFVALLTIVLLLNLGLVVAAFMLLIGHDKRSMHFAYLSLLASLTFGDLLVFYFDQFTAVFDVFVQLFLLLLISRYRQRYLTLGGKRVHLDEELGI